MTKHSLDTEWQELSSLLGGYFNQDFDADYPTPEAVIEGFRKQESPENAVAAAAQAHALASTGATEGELRTIVDDLGLYYAFWVDGWTCRAWLLHVAEVLQDQSVEPPVRSDS